MTGGEGGGGGECPTGRVHHTHHPRVAALQLMNGLDTDDVSLLPDVHATSAGLKAFTTWAAHYGIDTCRQACGGHGYSSYSRLPRLFADFAVMCTWEGA